MLFPTGEFPPLGVGASASARDVDGAVEGGGQGARQDDVWDVRAGQESQKSCKGSFTQPFTHKKNIKEPW